MRILVAGILIWCNSQWMGVAILKPYRSWSIEYSYGLTIDKNGKWINLWHFPTFGHCDIRKFLSEAPKR